MKVYQEVGSRAPPIQAPKNHDTRPFTATWFSRLFVEAASTTRSYPDFDLELSGASLYSEFHNEGFLI